MRKKKLLNLSAILLGALICFSFNKVQATDYVFSNVNLTRDNLKEVAQSNTLNTTTIELKLEESGYTDNDGKKIWKIVDSDRSNKDYYCLNMDKGFGGIEGIAEQTTDIYNYSSDFNLNDLNKYAYDTNISQETYNKLLWILNNTYVRSNDDDFYNNIEYKNLMKKLVEYKNDDDDYGIYTEDNNYNLTEDDIITAQKLAIWYYTDNYVVAGNKNTIGGVPADELKDSESGDRLSYSRHQKLLALKDYFINNADANYSTTTPSLTLSKPDNAKVVEDGDYYVAGPFFLKGENTEQIKEITTNVNVQSYKLLDADKKEVTNNELIGSDFYLKISKGQINQDTTINIDINYKYDIKTLTFMTDESDPVNTQPVVLVESKEQQNETKTETTITNTHPNPGELNIKLQKADENGNFITSSEATFDITEGTNSAQSKTTTNGILNIGSKTLDSSDFIYEYIIKETLAPIGYNLMSEELTVKISGSTKLENNAYVVDSGKITITDKNGNALDNSKIYAEYSSDSNTVIITVKNTKIKNGYSVRILKVKEDGNTALGGAYFKINDGQATQISEYGNNIGEGTLTAAGNLELKYKLEETIAPDGYVKLEGSKEVKIRADVEFENNQYVIKRVNLKEEIEGITVSVENNVITIKVENEEEVITGKYNVVLRKVNNSGKELSGAKIKVNGKEYTVGNAEIAKDENITSTDSITLKYTLEEVRAPEGFLGLNTTKNIEIQLEIEKLDKNYKVKRAYLDNEDSDITVSYDGTSTININVINNPIQKKFDLSLRKFITRVNDNALQREPVVDTSTIATTGTATYKHTKEPVSVQVGDIVTYTIRVYNEGETDGYASQITDYLPEWLDFLPDNETNKKYLWSIDEENNRKITTIIASRAYESGENIYEGEEGRENGALLSAYDGGETLDYIDVQIVCQVNDKVPVKQLITNIAEISKMQDKEGTEVITDRDSSKANVNLPTDIDLPNYKGHEDNKEDLTDGNYYYKGQEDDDDFEKLIVENFDLALRKFIVKINDTELKNVDGTYTREPVVDTSKLQTKDENQNIITTATYDHPKNPVQVVNGDIVTYTIRIYNEGTLSGFANEIIDNIPEGLEFVEDSSINKTYGWKLKDGKLVTNYLSDADINNLIKAANDSSEGNKVLNYKDVQVQFKVVANPVEYAGNIITNWAEIREDSNNDIDSIPGNDVKEEDDIDYEPVKLVYFDLSLRKFITNVNGTEINNRVPEVDTSKIGTIGENGKKITTATYTHTKDPIVLETGSIVIYTIRVYNEGSIDGYATEITDNIPEGLEFLPEDKTNTDYKWTMIDEEGNITQDVSKAKKITTNYLSEQNDSSQIINKYDDVNKVLSYKDVKVAFKVIEPNTSDRIVVNTAEISKDSDEDIDSIPGNNANGEDDIDNEYVKVETFDLSLKKWVTATKVTYDGKTKTTKTGFNENSTEMAKVDLVGSKLKKTTVKFVYNIKVTNEGEVAGYATEIKDYIPSGLKFVAKDNPDWKEQKGGVVTTDKLKDTLLEPGQSAIVEIVLTWKNSSTNMGVKTNWAEISVDSGDDVDSTPDNYNKLEDDIDDASVILSIKTGSVTMYITLTLISISILAGGTFLIKKYVIDK